MSTAVPDVAEPTDGSVPRGRSGAGRWIALAVLAVTVVAVAVWWSIGRTPGGPPQLRIERPQAGASPGPVAAVYLTVVDGGGADRLLGASTPAAAKVTLHENTGPQGVSLMEEVDSLEVPAGGRLELRPGGSHLMLEDLGAPLEKGGRIPVTLRFERSGARTVEVPVVGLTELAEEVPR